VATKTKSRMTKGARGEPTLPERRSLRKLKLASFGRRIIIGLLTLFVLLGLLGVFGSKTSGLTATGGGYQLSVVYPSVTRPGLPVRWIYTVRHPGGFDGKIEIATTFEYLNLFDLTNIQPDASSETATSSQIVWSFDPPEADVFIVEFDAATESGIHQLPAATAAVLRDGRPIVQVRFKTVVMP
jgi:hypothetical protein